MTRPQTIRIGDLVISFERRGDGPALVLLHGILQDRRAWRRQIDALSDEFTVVAWDAPGCGGSTDPPERFGMAAYADCLAGLIEALALDRPHVLGLSLGGAIALELYRRHPLVPRSLILAAAYAGWAGSLSSAVVEARLRQALAESDQPASRFVPAWLPGLLTPDAPPGLADEVVAIMSTFHPVGYRAMARAMAEADLRDVLPRIVVPTLLVYGDQDRRSPLSIGEGLHASIPGSRLTVLPGVGHLVNIEAAPAFDRAVRAFLHDVVRAPA